MAELSIVPSLVIDNSNFGMLLNDCRKTEKFIDVHLKIGDKLFPAHRAVLSRFSPVLEALISEQWSTTNVCEINDEYVDIDILETLMNVFYTGKVKLTLNNVHPIYMAAHFLQISMLLDCSVQYFSELITLDNVFTLIEFTERFQLKHLNKFCVNWLKTNYNNSHRLSTRKNLEDFECEIEQVELGDQLNQYRIERKFTDIQLQIGKKIVDVHSVVLALNSPVLYAMIVDQLSESRTCEISDEYVDPEIIEDLLSFIYTGNVQLTNDTLYPFYVAIDFLSLQVDLDNNVKTFSKLITVENVLALFGFAIRCEYPTIRLYCLRFIALNHELVLDKQEILEINPQIFRKLITGLKERPFDLEIYFGLRENTFDCIVRWVEEDLLERLDELPVLLENIPLEELSIEFLNETVSTNSLLKKSLLGQELLAKALKNHGTYSNPSFNQQSLIAIGYPMLSYDSHTKIWTELPENIHPWGWETATVSNQRDITVYECNPYADSFLMFNWSSQTWTEIPSPPIDPGFQWYSIEYLNDHLYIAVPIFDDGSKKWAARILCYSFKTGKWRILKNREEKPEVTFLIAFINHLYAYICDDDGDILQKYDPELEKWTVPSNLMNDLGEYHRSSGYHNRFKIAAVHEDKIYFWGKGGFAVYDPETEKWTSLPKPDIEFGTSMVSMNGQLLTLCCNKIESIGWREKDNYSTFKYDFSKQKWVNFSEFFSVDTIDSNYHLVTGNFHF